ncbi:hypothetical protein K1719_013006 [Acacia pycnantha]|nr:hypothetical protein K1719_013006 [Acacia pycnantha]
MEDSVTEGQSMLPPLNLMAKEGREGEKESGFHSDQKAQEERGEEDKVGGGLLRNLISTMATPLATKTGEAETEEPTRDEIPNKKEDDEEGGGIFNNIISNLFPQNDDEQGHKIVGDEKNKKVKTEAEINNGGGVIENIVSHFPPSIPDDAVPSADEATILINSLVRD